MLDFQIRGLQLQLQLLLQDVSYMHSSDKAVTHEAKLLNVSMPKGKTIKINRGCLWRR